MNFAQRVKQVRTERKLTQVQMARTINFSERQYQNLEAGVGNPRYDTILAIAEHFDVSLDYLAGRTDDPKVHQAN